MVRSVMGSAIWKRAAAAEQVLVEVPFEILMPEGESAEESPGLLVRGAVDLAFHEPEGWVIVDYKTDRRSADGVETLVEKYRAQVHMYARAWTAITGQTVHEAGLYFTHSRVYRKVPW
jgi:ATP-dependent helicase/nuclease subunit A